MSSANRGPGWTVSKRVEGKVAVVFGAGQSPGEGIGNGRAAAIRYAREGARVLAANRSIESAEETAAMIRSEGFECIAVAADVRRESDVANAIAEAHRRWGCVDILHNNNGPNGGTVPSYAELDARIAWRPTNALELSLVGRNLLHRRHPEYGFPSPAREEVARGLGGQRRLDRLRAVHPHDLRAHVGQHHGRKRPRPDSLDLDDLHALEGTHSALLSSRRLAEAGG